MNPVNERRGVATVAIAIVMVVVIAVVGVAAYELGSSKTSSSQTTTSTGSTGTVTTTHSTSSSSSFSIPQNSITITTTTAQTFTNLTGNTALAGQLVITKVNGDINSSMEQQVLYSLYINQTGLSSGNLPFTGNPGQTVWLYADLQFNACPCVGVVQTITSLTPGFTVIATSPAEPIQFMGGGGDYYTTGFSIEVMTPSTPFSGTLTLMDDVE